MNRIKSWVLMLLAVAAFVVAGAALVAMLRALAVPHTLSALESAFGTGVAALVFILLGLKAWRAGNAERERNEQEGSRTDGAGSSQPLHKK